MLPADAAVAKYNLEEMQRAERKVRMQYLLVVKLDNCHCTVKGTQRAERKARLHCQCSAGLMLAESNAWRAGLWAVQVWRLPAWHASAHAVPRLPFHIRTHQPFLYVSTCAAGA